ncbi:hypothetical protein V8E36_008799 [Tilletia maclaganii]
MNTRKGAFDAKYSRESSGKCLQEQPIEEQVFSMGQKYSFGAREVKPKLPEHNLGYGHLDVAAASIFLASKTEEQPRQIFEAAIAVMNAKSTAEIPSAVKSPENFATGLL